MSAPVPEARPASVTEYVGAEVRAQMGRHRVSQRQLAALLGISQAAMSNRLRGQTPFDVNEVGVLAAYFGVAPGELLPGRVEGAEKGGSVIHA